MRRPIRTNTGPSPVRRQRSSVRWCISGWRYAAAWRSLKSALDGVRLGGASVGGNAATVVGICEPPGASVGDRGSMQKPALKEIRLGREAEGGEEAVTLLNYG